jgi:aspartyl-tRNA(Asn)/glutamyl-tRNA(Gln) amidotransferase subunit A
MADDLRPHAAPFHSSIAGAAFAAARARLAAIGLDDPRRPLPLAYAVVGAPPSGRATRTSLDLPDRTGSTTTPNGPIGEALLALAEGRVSVKHLIDESLDAVERRDGELMAIVRLLADDAIAQAEILDGELRDGSPLRPLHGIPVTVKDVIDVAGVETRAGSDAYRDVPLVDAVGVARLRAAGAIVIAKTSTHEFALGVTNPQSRNPHDPSRIPGGSSGGSTIAVATGMGLGSLGTDTRASIRVPAALSGTVGFKPTFGRIPTDGVVSLSWSMDHIAPMATTVADAALLLDVLLGSGDELRRSISRAADLTQRPGDAPRWRVGVPDAAFTGDDPAVDALVRAAIDVISSIGGEPVSVTNPAAADFDDANALGLLISRAEAATFHQELGTDLSRCWAEISDQLEAAMAIPAVDYLSAQRRRGQLADKLLTAFDTQVGVNVLAMPTTALTAPPVDDFAQYLMLLSRNAIPWSLVGFPAISIPCGLANGLPVGLQLVARPGGESLLVEVGSAYELVRG